MARLTSEALVDLVEPNGPMHLQAWSSNSRLPKHRRQNRRLVTRYPFPQKLILLAKYKYWSGGQVRHEPIP